MDRLGWPSAFWSPSFFHDARFADSPSIFKREINSPARVNLSSALSANIGLQFFNRHLMPLECPVQPSKGTWMITRR
jgi:hypothetical protein